MSSFRCVRSLLPTLCLGCLAMAPAACAQKTGAAPDTPAPFQSVRVDSRRGCVYFAAKATGLGTGEPVEFLLVRDESAKDYEAVALSSAVPSEIHRALRSLGMAPGRAGGMNEDGIPLWPKGERVVVSCASGDLQTDAAVKTADWRPLESTVLDTVANAPMKARGFVFIGSEQLPPPGGTPASEKTVYAADAYGPQAMIALYNEPRAVMELPLQALQGDVYGRFVPNPEAAFEEGETITVRMRPEYPLEKRRAVEFVLAVTPAKTPVRGVGSLAFRLTRRGAETTAVEPSLPAVLSHLSRLRQKGHDPFVSLLFGRDVPIRTMAPLCRLLDTLDSPKGIRVEPPPENQLYYRAFVPNPDWRKRDKRVTQPLEVDIAVDGDDVRASVRYLEPVWEEGEVEHTLKVSETAARNARELAQEAQRRDPGMEALFLLAPPEMTYGALVDFTKAAREYVPTVYVFVKQG